MSFIKMTKRLRNKVIRSNVNYEELTQQIYQIADREQMELV